MPLTKEQKKSILKTMLLREKQVCEKEKKLKSQALQCALAVSHFLKENYSISKVYLYGSLAVDGHYDIHSDIDLFIVGWKEEFIYWKMLSQAQNIAKPFPISIVTENDALPSLIDIVNKEGRLLN